MPGSKQTTTSSQQSSPWEPAQDTLKNILSQANTIAQDTSAFTPTYQNTIGALSNFGNSQSLTGKAAGSVVSGSQQGYGQGLNELMATSSGQRMTNNPYMNQALSDAGRRTADQVNAQFSGAGRYGSGAHTGVLTDRLGELETKARMDQYSQERQNQLGASNTLLSGGYQGVSAASAADQAQAQRAQALVEAGKLTDQQTNDANSAQRNALDWLRGNATQIGAMGGQSSGTQTTSTPANKMGMVLGGAQMAAGIATGNPWMFASGAGQTARG